MKLKHILPPDPVFEHRHSAWMSREQYVLNGLEVYTTKLLDAIKSGQRDKVLQYTQIVRDYSRRLSIAVTDFPSKASG
jgi:hypothetical protein